MVVNAAELGTTKPQNVVVQSRVFIIFSHQQTHAFKFYQMIDGILMLQNQLIRARW
jgi:hypothetical protein